jgi:hypothetical protein
MHCGELRWLSSEPTHPAPSRFFTWGVSDLPETPPFDGCALDGAPSPRITYRGRGPQERSRSSEEERRGGAMGPEDAPSCSSAAILKSA